MEEINREVPKKTRTMSEKIPKDKIEQIVEQKVQKRVKEELKKRGIKQNKKNNTKQKESVSRRKFMKSIGAGALGAAGLAMTSNVTGLELDHDTITPEGGALNVEEGDLEIPQGGLYLTSDIDLDRPSDSDWGRITFRHDSDRSFRIESRGDEDRLGFHTYDESGTHNDEALSIHRNANVEIPNGNLQLSQNITADGNSITFGNDITLNADNNINLNDGNNDTLLTINQSGPVQIQDTDLRLDTGQAIEDEEGDDRIWVRDDSTRIRTEIGHPGIEVSQDGIDIKALDGARVGIRDSGGSFNAVRYFSSSSAPGTLELTNAKLQLYTTNSDPDASQGEMWYRSDLD